MFDLERLLNTVFALKGGERFGVFTDLEDIVKAKHLSFLDDPLPVQHHAYRTFFLGLRGLTGPTRPGPIGFYAYETTGGSNLDLPETAYVIPSGEARQLRAILTELDIVLYVTKYSATAPITALAKELGFRGATLHGVNDTILATGLSVDYEQVSARAERLRRAVEGADEIVMEFGLEDGTECALTLDVSGAAAQKSHGLVREKGDIANLPAGEVYFVPRSAQGEFPRKFEDGTVAVMEVKDGAVRRGFAERDSERATRFFRTIAEDPAAARITELGLGTQTLPFAGADIQDEKIIGTAHIATGRSDHLGGDITSRSFRNPKNAVHDDILFAPPKTPEIDLRRVVMRKGGKEQTLIESYRPAPLFEALL